MEKESDEKRKKGKPAKRTADRGKKPITEKQRQARSENMKKVGRKNGESIRAAKQKTEEIKARTFAKPTYTNPILFAYRIAKYFHYMDSLEWENTGGKHIGKPYTDTGIYLSLGIDVSTAKEIAGGSLDHIIAEQQDGSIVTSLEGIQSKTIHDVEPHILPYVLYLLGNPDYTFDKTPLTLDYDTLATIQEWGKNVFFSSIIQKATQTNAHQRELRLYDQGRTADIYATKAKDGWRDGDTETQRIELTTSAEARELLDTFYKLPQIIE